MIDVSANNISLEVQFNIKEFSLKSEWEKVSKDLYKEREKWEKGKKKTYKTARIAILGSFGWSHGTYKNICMGYFVPVSLQLCLFRGHATLQYPSEVLHNTRNVPIASAKVRRGRLGTSIWHPITVHWALGRPGCRSETIVFGEAIQSGQFVAHAGLLTMEGAGAPEGDTVVVESPRQYHTLRMVLSGAWMVLWTLSGNFGGGVGVNLALGGQIIRTLPIGFRQFVMGALSETPIDRFFTLEAPLAQDAAPGEATCSGWIQWGLVLGRGRTGCIAGSVIWASQGSIWALLARYRIISTNLGQSCEKIHHHLGCFTFTTPTLARQDNTLVLIEIQQIGISSPCNAKSTENRQKNTTFPNFFRTRKPNNDFFIRDDRENF